MNRASDQNGYAGMNSSWMMAFNAAIPTPIQRTPLVRAQMPSATSPWPTPQKIRIQPQVLRPLITNLAFSVKNVEFETAAIPSMMLIVARIMSITPANDTQPDEASSDP